MEVLSLVSQGRGRQMPVVFAVVVLGSAGETERRATAFVRGGVKQMGLGSV